MLKKFKIGICRNMFHKNNFYQKSIIHLSMNRLILSDYSNQLTNNSLIYDN